MTMSDRYSADPALHGQGPKRTDSDLPIRRRTHAAPYLIAIVIVLAIGGALFMLGGVRLTQSTSEIQNTGGALAPTEGLAPATGDGNSLRDNDAETTAPGGAAPAGIESRPNAADVPGGG